MILEMRQEILQRISNNKMEFRKELINSMQKLKTYDLFRLRKWVKDSYGKTHSDVIGDVFQVFLF